MDDQDLRHMATSIAREDLLDELIEGVSLDEAWRLRAIDTLILSRDEPIAFLLKARSALPGSALESVQRALQGEIGRPETPPERTVERVLALFEAHASQTQPADAVEAVREAIELVRATLRR